MGWEGGSLGKKIEYVFLHDTIKTTENLEGKWKIEGNRPLCGQTNILVDLGRYDVWIYEYKTAKVKGG